MELHDFESAVREFETAVALDPSDAMAHYNLAMALRMKGRHDAAGPHLDRALELGLDVPARSP